MPSKEIVTEKGLLEAFGEVSALFMSQDVKGTEIVMPEEDLSRIAKETVKKLNYLWQGTP